MIDLSACDWATLRSDPEVRRCIDEHKQAENQPRRLCWKCLGWGLAGAFATWFGLLVDNYSQATALACGSAVAVVALLLFRGWKPGAGFALERSLCLAVASRAGMLFNGYATAGAVHRVAPFLFGEVGNAFADDLFGEADGARLRSSTYFATGSLNRRIYTVRRGAQRSGDDEEEAEWPYREEQARVVTVLFSRGIGFDLGTAGLRFEQLKFDDPDLADTIDVYSTDPGVALGLLEDARLRQLLLETARAGELRFYLDPGRAVLATTDPVRSAAERWRDMPVEGRARAIIEAYCTCLARLQTLSAVLGNGDTALASDADDARPSQVGHRGEEPSDFWSDPANRETIEAFGRKRRRAWRIVAMRLLFGGICAAVTFAYFQPPAGAPIAGLVLALAVVAVVTWLATRGRVRRVHYELEGWLIATLARRAGLDFVDDEFEPPDLGSSRFGDLGKTRLLGLAYAATGALRGAGTYAAIGDRPGRFYRIRRRGQPPGTILINLTWSKAAGEDRDQMFGRVDMTADRAFAWRFAVEATDLEAATALLGDAGLRQLLLTMAVRGHVSGFIDSKEAILFGPDPLQPLIPIRLRALSIEGVARLIVDRFETILGTLRQLNAHLS